jgi:multiple sugar transport system ATP-binding protein
MAQLQLKNVTKSFGELNVIKDVNFECKDGEFIVFVGPSGCGKSTMLRMIAGLEDTTSGDILIGNKNVNNLAPSDRGIAMVFQSYALYPHMTVFENIAFPLRVQKLANEQVKKQVHEAAAILKLEDRLHHKPGELSGGQRQRVAIGRAIVRKPEIFLFDEPLSNLDAALRAEMRVELSALHSQLGATMVYVTHDQVEAMTMAERILVIDGGTISQMGSPLELYHKPRNKFVGAFIGNPKMNMIDVTGAGRDKSGVQVILPNGEIVTVAVECKQDVQSKKTDIGNTS